MNYRLSATLVLISMAICSFGIGTTEFLPAGLLPNIASNFNVSIPIAAHTVSFYAVAVGVGGPLLTAFTVRWSRKYILAGLMTLFILGSMFSVLALNFPMLIFSRLLTALCHGSFFGVGAVVVSSVVPENRKASAVAAMFMGLTVANVLGVPFGTLLGQHLGWRSAFLVIAIIGVIGLIGILIFIPRKLNISQTHLMQELAVFKRLQIWGALVTTALGFSGLITCFTYIAPIMKDITGFASSNLSWIITIYGIGLVIGNFLGGKACDRSLTFSLYSSLIALITLLLIFIFTAHYKIPAIITLFLLGAVGFSLVPPLVRNVMTKAEEAPTLASTANISAFNLGISLSVYLGGVAINAGLGYTSPIWVGAILAIIALMIAILTSRFNCEKHVC